MPIFSIFTGVLGATIGIFAGIHILDYLAKRQLRERIESEAQHIKSANKYINPRKEERRQIHYSQGKVRMPLLDNAGIVTEEETTFEVSLVDISPSGVAILSQTFIKTGLIVEISLKSENSALSFPYRKAEVRNIFLTSRGLRIGLQFTKET